MEKVVFGTRTSPICVQRRLGSLQKFSLFVEEGDKKLVSKIANCGTGKDRTEKDRADMEI